MPRIRNGLTSVLGHDLSRPALGCSPVRTSTAAALVPATSRSERTSRTPPAHHRDAGWPTMTDPRPTASCPRTGPARTARGRATPTARGRAPIPDRWCSGQRGPSLRRVPGPAAGARPAAVIRPTRCTGSRERCRSLHAASRSTPEECRRCGPPTSRDWNALRRRSRQLSARSRHSLTRRDRRCGALYSRPWRPTAHLGSPSWRSTRHSNGSVPTRGTAVSYRDWPTALQGAPTPTRTGHYRSSEGQSLESTD